MGLECEHEWAYDPSRLALSYPPQSYYKCVKYRELKVVCVVSADIEAEYWSPTFNLRYAGEKLQQEYRSNTGKSEWRDVEKFEV